jgi:DivIVA domain-containing protein
MLTSAEIRSTTFTVTRWREGYDKAEVDAFLARAALALDTHNPLSSLEVINVSFQPTRFREGYNQDQVDDFLDRLAKAPQ